MAIWYQCWSLPRVRKIFPFVVLFVNGGQMVMREEYFEEKEEEEKEGIFR